MNCEFYMDLINGHIDGMNTESEEEQLQKHLKSCEQCRALMQTLRANDAKLKAAKVEVPADLTARIMTKVHNTPKRSKKPFYISVASSAVAAAAVLAIFLSGKVSLPSKSSDEAVPVRKHIGAAVHTEVEAAEAPIDDTILEIPQTVEHKGYFYGTEEATAMPDKAVISDETPVLVICAEARQLDFSGERIPVNELHDYLKDAKYTMSGKETGAYLVSWYELLRIASDYDGIFEMQKHYSDDVTYLRAVVVFVE